MNFKTILISIAVLVFLHNTNLKASIVTVFAEGYVDDIKIADNVELDGSVEIDTLMTCSFIYDTESPDLYAPENHGIYNIISIEIKIGNYTFYHRPGSEEQAVFETKTQNPAQYKIRSSDPYFDGTIFIDDQPKTFEDLSWDAFIIGFGMYSLYEILPEAIPTVETFPDLSFFDGGGMGIAHDESIEQLEISSTITNIQIIPEPATILLLGLGSLAIVRRKK